MGPIPDDLREEDFGRNDWNVILMMGFMLSL